MKDQYFGDVNDYLKYGLLRCFGESGLHMGVCWMMTPDDGRSDGGKLRYLRDAKRWRGHDPQLFDRLKSTVGAGDQRQTSTIQDGIISSDARFWSDVVPDNGAARSLWFERALAALSSVDLIFFDPDNGLEVRSRRYGSRDSSKYLYWREAAEAWELGCSLLIFQHFPREKRDTYVERIVRLLTARAPGATVVPIRTPSVLFLLAAQPQHALKVAAALGLIKERWEGPISLSPIDMPQLDQGGPPPDRNVVWRWAEGIVDRAGEHLQITCGDDVRPVALVGQGSDRRFAVQFLYGNDMRAAEVRKELDFYLTEVGGPHAWNYAIYHCGTSANFYSNVHWNYFPEGERPA